MAVIYEPTDFASSSTHHQLMDRDEDPRAGATSPGVALPKMLAPAPCTTKSCSQLLVLSTSQGPASTTSVQAAPYGVLLAPSNSIADATTSRRRATRTNEA
jgi:hypothetical protein